MAISTSFLLLPNATLPLSSPLTSSFPLLRTPSLFPVCSSSIELEAGVNSRTTTPCAHLGCFLAASACALASLAWVPHPAQSVCLHHPAVTPPPAGDPQTPCLRESPMESRAPSIFWLSEPDRRNPLDTESPLESSGLEVGSQCAKTPAKVEDSVTLEVTNESIIEEAWQVVNERFLDARHHKWSSEAWQKKREEMFRRPVPSRLAAYSIIRSMLSELNDPYTRFITPRELKQLSKYDMTGIGLSLGELGGQNGDARLQVVGIVLGSPAQLSGVKQGDELLTVDGIDVSGKSAFEASSLIQGRKGTTVSIKVRHGPCGATENLLVERQMAVQTPVYYRVEHKAGEVLGYIRVKEFNALAKRDLVTAMGRLQLAGASYLLLDLRDNPGGLVQAGIEIAKVFLDQGNTVIYTVGRDPGTTKSIAAMSQPLTTAPLMVLVNDHTASASEIVAAALHDNCRAVLVGHRTFGKGLIQSVFELSDGSGVILTVGKYVTPHHKDLDGNGIEPDFQELPGLIEAERKMQKCSVL